MMSTLSPEIARAQIVEILCDTVYHALGLKEILDYEREALEKQDIDGIDRTVDTKSACVHAMTLLDTKRIELCTACGFAAGPEQMQQMIDWCDDSDLVKNRWDHLMLIGAECSAINLTNGAIIRVRQQQFESSLSLLRGVTPGFNTYGRHGGEAGDYGRQSLVEA